MRRTERPGPGEGGGGKAEREREHTTTRFRLFQASPSLNTDTSTLPPGIDIGTAAYNVLESWIEHAALGRVGFDMSGLPLHG